MRTLTVILTAVSLFAASRVFAADGEQLSQQEQERMLTADLRTESDERSALQTERAAIEAQRAELQAAQVRYYQSLEQTQRIQRAQMYNQALQQNVRDMQHLWGELDGTNQRRQQRTITCNPFGVGVSCTEQ